MVDMVAQKRKNYSKLASNFFQCCPSLSWDSFVCTQAAYYF